MVDLDVKQFYNLEFEAELFDVSRHEFIFNQNEFHIPSYIVQHPGAKEQKFEQGRFIRCKHDYETCMKGLFGDLKV